MLRHLILVSILVLQVTWASEIKKAADEATCKGHDIDINDEEMMVILECAEELQITSKKDLTPEKMPCFGKCLIEKKGFIDHDGKPHKEKIMDTIDSKLPEALKEEVKMHLSKCLDEHASKVMANDTTCKSYAPLTDCVHKAYLHICTGN